MYQQTYGTGVGQIYPPSVGLPLGTTGTVGSPVYPTTTNTSLSSTRPTQTTASGGTLQPQAQPAQQPTSGYSPAVNQALTGATNWSGEGQPGTNYQTPQGVGNYSQTNTGSTYQPPSNITHNYYSQPSGSTAAPRVTPEQMYGTQQAQDYRGKLSGPGAYEQWYQDNASRYNQPTTLSSYYQSVAGQFGGQRFQPTTSQQAYSQAQNTLGGTSSGQTNAQMISQQLSGQRTSGENTMNNSLAYLQGPNQATDYYNANRNFYSQPGAIENYYRNNAQQFQQAGYGENYARGALGSQDFGNIDDMLARQTYGDQALQMAQGMVGNNQRAAQVYGANQDVTNSNLVGSELDYFRDPLRAKSYSEQLYESGNQGLNTYYARENEKAQEALANRMAAFGTFGSGETVRGMAEIDADMGAAQAKEMATLALQGDQQRLARAGQLTDMAGAAGQEELARRGLSFDMAMGADQIGQGNMRGLQDAYGLASGEGIAKMQQYLAGQDTALNAANTGLQLDRDAISRLTAGGNLASQSSQYGLDRVNSGMDAASTADQSRISQGTSIANVGNMLSNQELQRLGLSSSTGLAADQEQRARMEALYGMASDRDQLGLSAQAANLDWLSAGGAMAGNVDQGNLDWLNAGGDAADLAQQRFETRERYGFLDPMALGQAMAGSYGNMASGNTAASNQDRQTAINLLMSQRGMSADAAQAEVDRLWQIGQLGTLFL